MHVILAQFYRFGHTQVGCQNGFKSFFPEYLVGKIMDAVIMCLRLFGLYHAYVCVTLGVSGLLISRCKSLFF